MRSFADTAVRSAAINPLASVCVTAPAGSGKTELLIQRYLCLLGRVQRPEQVLAITFTRKAAAEMRERVIQALQGAVQGGRCETPHQQTTRELAETALAANDHNGWDLLRHTSRLNIKTIDSFCAGLTRQMPVLSRFGGQANVQDDVTALYEEAVQELFELLELDHPVAPDLERLLLHFGNNWEQLQSRLVAMLAVREQWRAYVGVHYQPHDSENYLIASVSAIVTGELEELSRLLHPNNLQILELLQFACANLNESVPSHLPGTTAKDLNLWNRIRILLVTKQGQWRRTITKNEGFPSDSAAAKQRKSEWKTLVAELQQIDGLLHAFNGIASLPDVEPMSTSWQLVLHLSRLLPTLTAHLMLVFRKHSVVDHSQVAQSALVALGEDDTPTDLALRLDYQIEHVLVDEFQDTAITQYELLHKLTRGWGDHNETNPRAPRTLMIVGDGMQSIYGFRGANVGLFLKARRQGFNGIALQHLELRCNFRSSQGVVNWINDTFTQAFPARNDIYRSAVSFSPAMAVRPQGRERPVELHGFQGESARGQEVDFICQQIAKSAADDEDSIAVLGRSRSHLQLIITRLKALQIPYYAPELDSLGKSPVVTDLVTLCRALTSDADRLAWMALLRAPWCGLQLSDMLVIAEFGEDAGLTPVWSVIRKTALLGQLTTDGRSRLQRVLPTLYEAREKRDRLGLRAWLEQAWMGLGGPQCVPDRQSLLDAEHFLQLLETADAEGVGLDLDWLSRRLQRAYMNAGDPLSKVHLLTLHKAKGLEFDQVIIPQLDRLPNSGDRDILLWSEHSNTRGERSFLLAADDRSPADMPTLYSYLRLQNQRKMDLEATRLLYVGATRAKSKLVLTANVKIDTKTREPLQPYRRSLLRPVWATFQQQMVLHEPAAAHGSGRDDLLPRLLTRIVCKEPPRPYSPSPETKTARNHLALAPGPFSERCIGIVVHKALEELSWRDNLPTDVTDTDRRRWRSRLQREGLSGKALDAAAEGVVRSVAQSLRKGGDGRWVLAKEHRERRSEWRLTTVDQASQVRDIVIDRSFIDTSTGVRWIIDYKNSQPAQHEQVAAFVARESSVYSTQLRSYRDAVQDIGNEHLRCALFFTALGHLHVLDDLDLAAREEHEA